MENSIPGLCLLILATSAGFTPLRADVGTTDTSRARKAPTSIPGDPDLRSPLSESDSLSSLRNRLEIRKLQDSLDAYDSKRIRESNLELRQGRLALSNVDTSLFLSPSGTIGPDYPLGPGDVLVMNIWGQKQAQYELEISNDGQILIPYVGGISLNGLSFKDATGLIRRRLKNVYSGIQSGHTDMDITLKKLKLIRVFVVGEVVRPGGFVFSGATSCLQAIAHAGGPSDRGSERIARVSRGDSTFEVDLYSYLFLGKHPRNDILRDGDVVRIPAELPTATALGAVARPGVYEIKPGESVHDLATFAGDFRSGADPDQSVRLVRRMGPDRITYFLGSTTAVLASGRNVALQPGDLLAIPARALPRRGSPVIDGMVVNPGTIPFEPGMTTRKALALAGGPLSGANLAGVLHFRFDTLGRRILLPENLEAGPGQSLSPMDSIHIPSRKEIDQGTVEISGSVKNPGSYPWSRGLRLQDLLAMAGGPLPDANLGAVRVETSAPAGSTRTGASTVALDPANPSGSPELDPYTLVSVPGTGTGRFPSKVRLEGMFKNPGSYALAAPEEKVASLVRRSGGAGQKAYPEGLEVWRPTEGRIPCNLASALSDADDPNNVALRDGDSLFLPERPATVTVEGYVNRPTQVLWHKGKSWKWYVRSAGDFADSANRGSTYVRFPDGSIQSASMSPDAPTPGSSVVVPKTIPPRLVTDTEKVSAAASIITALAAILTVFLLYRSR